MNLGKKKGNKKKCRKDTLAGLHRHRRRMCGIVVLGILLMLFLSVEYIRGGTEQIQYRIYYITENLQRAMENIRQQTEDLLTDRFQTRYCSLPEDHMQVHFLDVGQADCTLVITDEAAMLIDGGNADDGGDIVAYLRKNDVERLDYVIATHPHEDHIGGLSLVLEEFEADTVLLTKAEAADSFAYKKLWDVLAASETPVVYVQPGQEYAFDGASFEVIAPWRDYGDDLNNWSVGLRLVFGENTFLFTGDAEELAELDMVESGQVLQADVWKAGHHGSESSNSDWILDVADPDYTVISCGKDNSYGHPHRSVLRKFETRGIQVFRTDEQGTIIADCDGTKIIWKQ